jgi:diadenosine tetraphosphate (Ap4A) HIT family hydrolase
MCAECAALRPGSAVRVVRRGTLVVHGRLEPGGVPGWMVVAPERHVESLDALTAAEQAVLMPLVAEVTVALRAETPCEKAYVAVFSEVLPHLHFHVIARPPGLPEEDRGPRVFAAPPVASRDAEDVTRRVLARLATAPARGGATPKDPALKAALLSALVCPGAGQIRNRDYAKGIALIGLTVATAGYLLVRMLTEVLRLLPTDGTVIDPMSAIDIASEIQARNAGTFSTLSFVLLVLWIYGTVDAWFSARRRAVRATLVR